MGSNLNNINYTLIKAIIKRIISSLLVIFLVVTFVFVLLRLAPGNPAHKFISPEFSPQLVEQVTKSFDLDKPIFTQYISFISNLFQGDLGISYTHRLPVTSLILEYLPITALLAFTVFIFQTLFGFSLAINSVRKSNRITNSVFEKLSFLLYVIPTFVMGLVLLMIFSVQFNLLPASGIKSLNYDQLNFIEKVLDVSSHLILPVLTLCLGGTAVFYRYIRDNLSDVFNQTFIINLRAMGYDEKTILWKHIIPHTIKPFISIAGIELGVLLGGTLITEVIFSLPGMGSLTVAAIFDRDYPLVIGCTLISALLMIISNLIADLIKIRIDKRLVKELLQ